MRTRVALLACLLSLLPSLARSAGTVTFTETSTPAGGGLSDQVINIAECNGTVSSDTLTLAWTLGAAFSGTMYYRIYASTSSSCLTNASNPHWPPTGTYASITGDWTATSSQTGTWTTGIDVLSDLVTPLGVSCTNGGTIYFCVTVFDGTSAAATIQDSLNATGSIQVDTTTPGQPTGVSTSPGDGALTVSWTAGSGTAAADRWVVTATAAPADPALGCAAGGTDNSKTCSGSSTTSCRITGLTNGACYDVTVQAFSKFENPSLVSDAAVGVPRAVDDFWDTYQRAGGREQGGCSTGSASALALLALATAAPRLRRRRP